MSKTDKQIIKRILLHCNEVIKAHEHFCDSQDLFMDEENGAYIEILSPCQYYRLENCRNCFPTI